MRIKLHWAERFINYMTYNTNLYERRTKATTGLDRLAKDKRLFDQLKPFFDKLYNELYEEAYRIGFQDGVEGNEFNADRHY